MNEKPKHSQEIYKPRYLGWIVHKINYDPETGKIIAQKTEIQVNADLVRKSEPNA